MKSRHLTGLAGGLTVTLLLAACGGSSSAPTASNSPSTGPTAAATSGGASASPTGSTSASATAPSSSSAAPATGSSVGANPTGSMVGLTHDSSKPLVVWTDSTRLAGFQSFAKSHPDVKLQIQTYDAAALLTKIQLFNRTGAGWPDVLFDPVPDQIASLASTQYKQFPVALDAAIPASIQKGFGTANTSCTVDGKLVCIKNDLAQTVLWYDKSLMTKWGYRVPTTWAEYQALGATVAQQHPGYVLGSAGSPEMYSNYFVPSGCPLADAQTATSVHIDALNPKCARVASMLDAMVANGSVSKLGVVDPAFLNLGAQEKILMMPGASFYGDFLFKPKAAYNEPSGVLAAAPMPKWDGEPSAWSGSGGGGIYLVSSHSKNEVGAVAVIQWMATDPTFQVSAPTYPAYQPVAAAWAKHLTEGGFYAADPFPAMQAQAPLVNPVQKYVRYDLNAALNATVVQAVSNGSSISKSLTPLQTQLNHLAQAAGYAVVK